MTGGKVTGHSLAAAGDQRRLAGLVIEALIAQPICSKTSQALFHGDPHAGNLFLTRDQRLAVLDWSLVGSLGEGERIAMVQILLGAMSYHPEQMVTTLMGLADQRVDRSALTSVVHTRLGQIRQGQFPGFTWLMGLLDETVQSARLHVSTDLLLFRKTLHTLEGVIADIGSADSLIDNLLRGAFLRHLAVEWPQRWLAFPYSRVFATRLSNADLAQWLLTLPWAVTQFWLDSFPRADRCSSATS